MSAEIGVLLRGSGWVAGEHVRAFGANPYAEILAIDARTEARSRELAGRFGIEPEITVDRYADALKRDDIHAVSICTINYQHADEAVMAAEAGKHILIEKPLACTLDDLHRVADAVRANGVRTVLSFVLRWNPLVTILKGRIEAGDFGEIFYGAVDYWHNIAGDWKVRQATAGGSLAMGGCHAIDCLRYLTGQVDATQVTALSSKPFRRPEFDYDPTIHMLIRFENGGVGKVGSSMESNMPYLFNIEILGTKGSIRNDRIWLDSFKGQNEWMQVPALTPNSGDVAHHPFQGEIDHFVECIREGRESHVNVDDAVKTHEIIFAAEESAAHGGEPVKLPFR